VTTEGDRYFWNARYVSAVFDIPVESMTDVTRFLKNEESVIRHHLTRLESNLDRAKSKNYRNPYLNTR
jgi:ribosomal protein S6